MKRAFILMNFPLSEQQTADLTANWGVSSFCYPPVTIKKIWAEIPPEATDIESLTQPVIDWLGIVGGNDIVVLHGDADAMRVVRKNSPQTTIITPVIVTGGGTFRHVRFKII
jgi:hypothetical protein